ncbi:hypothetical protein RvY_15464-1 [Ramazzottius varieornatus]|uniref:Ras-related protein Rab n=1 Tax=Ramazzottius varieornatus TaxID=947166 RepID=A0A1D1VV26_RAMVA|nr:hypothetical protein RvY_15464-1 [Ramazzottius varieornatus]
MMEESETLESPPTIRTTTESKKPITISLVDKPPDRTGVFTTDPLPSTSRGAGTHTLPHTAHIPVSPPQSLLRSDPKRREKLYKVLVIGDIGVGKTSCVKRYVHRFFSQQYRATIGVDFALKIINWDQNTVIRLQLWDIAGQERFGHMTRVYYKDAIGALIVFDINRMATFEAVTKWKKDLDQKVELPDGKPVPCVLLGNKCDQTRDEQVPEGPRMDQFLRENGFCGYFETSAKDNIGIDESARYLLSKIIENEVPVPAEVDKDRLRLDRPSPNSNAMHTHQQSGTCGC